jgi:hypothetical protein
VLMRTLGSDRRCGDIYFWPVILMTSARSQLITAN